MAAADVPVIPVALISLAGIRSAHVRTVAGRLVSKQ
jgi:hypothetical protein